MSDAADHPTRAQAIASPRVSVVMPFRDAGRYIAEALDSLLEQTLRDIEILAIDDRSVDDGPAIVADRSRRDPRLRLVANERPGFVPALNQGIALARAEFIARMDADDVALPDRFARQVAYLEAHPEVGAVGGQILALIDGTATVPPWWIDTPLDHDAIVSALRHRNAIHHPTAMIRRDALRSVGGYREAFVVVQDYDLWLRLSERTRLANLCDRVLRYRFHPEQATSRNVELAFLCTWSARHAARERAAGRPDPIRPETRIDREQTAAWGLDPLRVQTEIDWIRASHAARGHLLRRRHLRAAGAFAVLFCEHPLPFLRRAALALRASARRRDADGRALAIQAWPASR
jgi:hypothetical protein